MTCRRSIRFQVHSIAFQVLQDLRSGTFVLDDHMTGMVFAVLFLYCAPKLGIRHPLSEHVEQVVILVHNAPGRAHAEIVEFAALVRGVPALNLVVEVLWKLMVQIAA